MPRPQRRHIGLRGEAQKVIECAVLAAVLGCELGRKSVPRDVEPMKARGSFKVSPSRWLKLQRSGRERARSQQPILVQPDVPMTRPEPDDAPHAEDFLMAERVSHGALQSPRALGRRARRVSMQLRVGHQALDEGQTICRDAPCRQIAIGEGFRRGGRGLMGSEGSRRECGQ